MRALALFVAAPLALFAPQLIHRISLAPGDDYIIDTPYRTLSARIWATGHIPVWDPFSFGGAPMLALGQAGVFYPPNMLFRVLKPVAANNVLVLATFVVAALGTYLLAHHLTGDVGASVIAGLAFAFCGYMFGHLQHVALAAAIAYLPWALYGLEMLRVRFTPWRLLGAAIPVALASLTGHGQMFATLVLGVGVYAAVVAFGDRGRTLVRAAAMVAAGAAIAAVQILPALAMLPHTLRQGFSYQDAMSYSFPLSHLPLLVFPYLFGNAVKSGPYTAASTTRWDLHDLSAYPGLVVLCFAFVGVAARRVDIRVRALLVLAAVGLLLSVPPPHRSVTSSTRCRCTGTSATGVATSCSTTSSSHCSPPTASPRSAAIRRGRRTASSPAPRSCSVWRSSSPPSRCSSPPRATGW